MNYETPEQMREQFKELEERWKRDSRPLSLIFDNCIGVILFITILFIGYLLFGW